MSGNKQFKVTLCRVENTIYEFNIRANSEKEAEDLAWTLYNQGEESDHEDVVHAEEFTHQVEEL